MIEVKKIYPECNADTLLVELILQRGKPAHYAGISKVAAALEKSRDDIFVIGLVDTDKFKNNPPLIDKFTEIVDDRIENENIIVLKIPNTNKHIIRINPAFEKWAWNTAQDCGIMPATYGFDTIDKLIAIAKPYGVFEDSNFKKFVNAIIQANPPQVQTLRNWLSKVFE
jgi:hypothetical protein